jgi:hypothetical protein
VSYRTYGDPVEPPRQRVERLLRAWSDFPASRDPRPLVLLSSGVVTSEGFPDGATKLAFVRGAIDAVPGFPADLLDVLRSRRQQHDGPRLLMTAASQGTAEFVTDRGRRQLPAWDVRAQGVPTRFSILDPLISQQAWWPPELDRSAWRGTTAALSDEGCTVTMRFTGTPFAYADYPSADVFQVGAAIAVIPTAVNIGPPGPRLAYAQKREVGVTLADPLGARVLLDQHGEPVLVQA